MHLLFRGVMPGERSPEDTGASHRGAAYLARGRLRVPALDIVAGIFTHTPYAGSTPRSRSHPFHLIINWNAPRLRIAAGRDKSGRIREELRHARRPPQISPQIRAPLPCESPEISEGDLVCVRPPVGLHAPSQIRAAPRRQSIAARETPQNPRHQLLAPLGAADAVFALAGVA